MSSKQKAAIVGVLVAVFFASWGTLKALGVDPTASWGTVRAHSQPVAASWGTLTPDTPEASGT